MSELKHVGYVTYHEYCPVDAQVHGIGPGVYAMILRGNSVSTTMTLVDHPRAERSSIAHRIVDDRRDRYTLVAVLENGTVVPVCLEDDGTWDLSWDLTYKLMYAPENEEKPVCVLRLEQRRQQFIFA
jgi:hypothetical protein